MYIIYNGIKYPCICNPSKTMVYRGLPDDFPAPVSGEITLCADDGFTLRKDNTADYLRQTFEGGTLVLTNEPEPEPVEPESRPDPAPSFAEDTAAMLVDHEYRLTLLELGISEC